MVYIRKNASMHSGDISHYIYIKYKKANELDDSFWLIKLDSINLIAFHIHCCIPNSYSGRFLGCSFRYPIKALILAFCTSYLFGGCVIRICVFGFSSLSNKNKIVKNQKLGRNY